MHQSAYTGIHRFVYNMSSSHTVMLYHAALVFCLKRYNGSAVKYGIYSFHHLGYGVSVQQVAGTPFYQRVLPFRTALMI
ncbi:hypothetical protein D3C87_1817080 [compost metagenome]